MKVKLFTAFILFLFVSTIVLADGENCIQCHSKVTPNIVKDWKLSKHYQNDVDCSVCHGDEHTTMKDFAKAEIPTPETCATCHEEQVDQFMAGKHSHAWQAIMAMPTIHMQPWPLIEGAKGCGSCHTIGVKTEKELEKLHKEGSKFGHASCDACHTRHTFSVKEAKQPQACQSCHMGFDHPQWEMYSGSKHGVRYLLKQNGVLPKETPAPTCQDCHMENGNHNVRTAWGFLAVRLPLPENPQWKKDQITILKALGVLDTKGNPTALLDVVKAADLARLNQKDWDYERNRMIKVCSNCHSENFAKAELHKGDIMIQKADSLMAAAIRIVDGLYKDGIIKKPGNYLQDYPWLLTFHDAPTVIEQKLFVMFLEHRMRTFQGTFHANADYALWYGWSEMVRDLSEIKELAKQMRFEHQFAKKE